MTLSIGVVRHGNAWKTCMMEQGQLVEQYAFENTMQTLSYLTHTCARYPELTLAVSPACETPFLALSDSTERQWEDLLTFPFNDWTTSEACELLIAIKESNLHSYLIPSMRYLPGIPLYRRLSPRSAGSSNDVCVVAALLFRLREREATWPEMQLFCVQVNRQFKSIQALEDGGIVNSMATEVPSDVQDERMRVEYERALWEGLTQDIAGLMAIHHIEDIVALGDYQEAFIDHFAENYQVYLFPSTEADTPGFECALGAAVLAEGLFQAGKACEIVERLSIRQACVEHTNVTLDEFKTTT
jgi:predicted butyrate kinase (DUF1464 family)